MFHGKGGKVAVNLETITPVYAAEVLKKSEGRNFRPLRRVNAEQLAKAIVEGRWTLNGESIVMNENGDCIDGQHRLLACVIAQVPIQSIVVRGVADDTYIDAGMSRTTAQVLQRNGVSYATVVAAVSKYAEAYERGVRTVSVLHGRTDRGRLVAYALAHPELQESAKIGDVARKIIPTSTMTWVHFEANRRNLGRAAEAFIGAVASGAGLEENNPALVLRNRALASKGTRKLSKWHMLILVVKAWNAWAAGEPALRLQVYSGREGIIELPEFYSEEH